LALTWLSFSFGGIRFLQVYTDHHAIDKVLLRVTAIVARKALWRLSYTTALLICVALHMDGYSPKQYALTMTLAKEGALWLALTRKPREGQARASSLAGGTPKPKSGLKLGFRFYFKCADLVSQNKKN
jgi:hypothetical protein